MNRIQRGRHAAPSTPRKPVTQDLEISEYMPASDNINRFKVAPTPNQTAPPPEPLHAETASKVERAHNGIIVAEREILPTEQPESPTQTTKITLDELPAFKAAMESLEKRGIPIFEASNAKPTGEEPATKKRRAKAKPTKRKRNLLRARKFRRPSVPRKQSQPKTQAQIDVVRHRRVCTICHHPDREAIEEAFLQWRNVRLIANEFDASGGATSIYRHARALNLFKKRNLTLRTCLEFVIEQSERIMPTAEGLVKAIRAYTRINDAGEWIDTPTTHIVKVVPMPRDGRNLEDSSPGLTLDVRKDRSNIIYPNSGQIESAVCSDEGRVQPPLLPGSAQKAECDVTV